MFMMPTIDMVATGSDGLEKEKDEFQMTHEHRRIDANILYFYTV